MENDTIVQLEGMGFERHQIDAAIQATNSTNIEVLITYFDSVQNPPTEAPKQAEGGSIGNMVNQEHVAALLSLGYSKNVSEKSLLFTENKTVEDALKWIEEHKNDADFEEELRMIQQESKRMTPQEAAEAARELSRKIRENRKKQEEQDELERERNRIKSGKQITDVRRELEEIKKRQDAEAMKKQRIQDQKDKDEMLEVLRRDREARGHKVPAQSQGQQQQQARTYTPFELFTTGVKQIKTASPPDLLPDKAKGSLSLIQKILENIIKNPAEPKFRKISLTSQVFQTKIEDTFGARSALDSLGFHENDGFYQYSGDNIQLLSQALQVVISELVGL